VQRAYFPEVIRLLDRYYGHVDYSLTSLFHRRAAAHCAADSELDAVGHRELADHHLRGPRQPAALSVAGRPAQAAGADAGRGFAINAGLRRALETDPIDQAQMRSFLSLAKADQVPLETATLSTLPTSA
jgi:hypothetical protein